MIPARYLPFEMPGETPEAAKHAHNLNISIGRKRDGMERFVYYELHGGFCEDDGDPLELLRAVMNGFTSLTPLKSIHSDDEDDGDDWKKGGDGDDNGS